MDKSLLRRGGVFLVLASFGVGSPFAVAEKGLPVLTVGDALSVSLKESPKKGILGRSVLDKVRQSKLDLQLALVIDGTDSMRTDIDSVSKSLQSIVNDIRGPTKDGGGKISLALVVYRDALSPSGPVAVLISNFTDDIDKVRRELELLERRTEDGAPYYEELVDVGVYRALTELNWASPVAEDVIRWILVVGDAPPFDEVPAGVPEDILNEFQKRSLNAQTWQSGRFHSSANLCRLANEKKIVISSIICNAKASEANAGEYVQTFRNHVPRLRTFFDHLARSTAGDMLDLSDPKTIRSLVDSARNQRTRYQYIGMITLAEVEAARRAMFPSSPPGQKAKSVRVAVLPHVPLQTLMSQKGCALKKSEKLDPVEVGLLVSMEMRQRLGRIANCQVVDSHETGQMLDRWYRSKGGKPGISEREFIKEFANYTQADHLIWGTYRESAGEARLESGIYKDVDGDLLARAENSIKLSGGGDPVWPDLTSNVLLKLIRNAFGVLQANLDVDPRGTLSLLTRPATDVDLRADVSQPLSRVLQANRYLLYGLESLEKAVVEFRPPGSPYNGDLEKLLQSAVSDLTVASEYDPENPVPYLFLASAYYNLAYNGDMTDAMNEYLKALEAAFQRRASAPTELMKKEVEADYALLIEKNAEKAIQLYEQLTNTEGGKRDKIALRAHWMLAGIRSGDWGVDATVIDVKEARRHIVQILAGWDENTSLAKFFRKTFVDQGSSSAVAATKGAIPLWGNVLLQERLATSKN
mgnify:CR=1 FL=1